MSLINQMLQDLEKRQPGAVTGMPSPTLVAVPTPRRIHPAWGALPLLVIAVGLFVWLAGGRPAPQIAAATTPSPAKTDISQIRPIQPPPQPPLDSLPSGNLAIQVARVSTPVEKPAEVIPSPATAGLPQKAETDVQPEKTEARALSTLHESEGAPVDFALPRASAAEAKQKPQTRANRPPPLLVATSASEKQTSSAGVVTKQIKEMTPQQQAENATRKAVAMVQQGRTKEAVDELTHALQLDPRHTAARQTLVGLLLEANRFGDAERKLQEGLAIAPEQPDLVMILARLQVERGDVRGGLASLERALPYASENADYQAFLAALLQREGRHREASAHYLLALRNAPQTGVWLMGLGISLQAENRLPEAREAFSRARTSNTLSPELQAFVEQRLKQLG